MKFKTKPYKHQQECLDRFGRTKAFALLAEMGTGKTKIIIDNMAELYLADLCTDVLIFAPNGVHTNWTRIELGKHMPDEVDWFGVPWFANPKKDDRLAITYVLNNLQGRHVGKPALRIFTMNWDALRTKRGLIAIEMFIKNSDKLMIVCDESDAIKNPKTKRTKALLKLRDKADYRRIMTGTPVNNSPFDLFTQFSFLDPNILECTSFYAFKALYAELLPPDNPLVKSISNRTHFTPQLVAKGPGGKPKYKNLEHLSSLIEPHSFRVLKKDCLDLPKKIYKTLFFDLTKEQQVVYDKMKKECRLLFEDEETPFTKLVSMTKLAQITSGYVLHPTNDEPVRIEGCTPKLDMAIACIQRIINSGEKVIVWARYRIEIADIVFRLTELGISLVEYHGGVKQGKDRDDAIDEFENGEAQVFVGNPQAAGMGITLVASCFSIYFSNSFSYRDRAQSEDRNHRIGQEKPVTYINIAARGTIDEIVIEALLNKKDVAKTIIDRGLEILE